MTSYEKFGTSIYNPERDGDSIVQYYLDQKREGANALFHGSEHYRLFQQAGALGIHISVVRLMWNYGGGDEGFVVVDDYNLEGFSDLNVHRARSGIFTPEEILDVPDAPRFEVSSLNPASFNGLKR